MSHHNNDGEHQDEQETVHQPNQIAGTADHNARGSGVPDDDRDADSKASSRPQQILRDKVDAESISDEEAVLAYNANADRQDEAENSGTAPEE